MAEHLAVGGVDFKPNTSVAVIFDQPVAGLWIGGNGFSTSAHLLHAGQGVGHKAARIEAHRCAWLLHAGAQRNADRLLQAYFQVSRNKPL
ncbi:hypothetical protein [Hymenobacter roseosalivarius]|uniref:hypothetical protein n=1 Tax=Hymenobacter roseosalivarius TaxID=89967 RepID=UPI00117A9584|nr:hypothetical protein [Hymenobacter roseosalivarius]